MEPIIIFDNVSKEYNLGKIGQRNLIDDISSFFFNILGKKNQYTREESKFWALKDVSFTIKKGETIGVIGDNGAGKSTLMKLLSRITSPTTGKIKVNGTISSLLELGTGFHPDLTGRENIFLNGAILRLGKKQIAKKVDDIIEFSDLQGFIDTPIKRYSSGMYARLAFSIAINVNTDIIILDEVLSVGDMGFSDKSRRKIRDLVKNEGRTAIIVSHNLTLIERECDKVLLLNKGEVLIYDKPKKVIDEYFRLALK